MKANELMLGDIVLYEYDGQKFPAGVIEIYRNSVLVESINGEYEPIEIEEDKIFPIPLTPEILEKNGFGYKENDAMYTHFYPGEPHYCIDMDFHIGTASFDVYWLNYRGNDICGLRLVHELQHALRLCGIEKEIVL